MAFNPFDVFRRNQRILFAVLTVFVMFMFVLSSGLGGGGDFFDWLPQWLGSQSRSGETVATLGGKRVTTSQIGDVAQQRRLANRYMILATDRTRANLAKYVADYQQRVSQANAKVVSDAYQAHTTMEIFAGRPITPEIYNFILQQVGPPIESLQQLLTKKDLPEDDQEIASAARSLLEADLRLVLGGADQQYFTNAANQTDRDRLNFILWQKKADQLGINLTVKDMEVLLDAEFQGRLNNEDRIALTEAFQDMPGYTPDALRQALIDEFEVRIAQQAIMGSEYVRNQGTPVGTPYDYFDFYREKTAEAKFGIIRIPVSNYLDKVEGEPKESELRKLYANHRSDVPNPGSPKPGFREPRKLKLTWLEVLGNEPYYAKKAETTFGIVPALFGMSVIGQGTHPLNALAATVIAESEDLLLDAEAQAYRTEYNQQLDNRWFQSAIDSPVTDGTVTQPATIGSLAGLFAGNIASGGPALAGLAASYDSVNVIDRQARLKTLPSAFIVPIMGGPAVFDSLLVPIVAQAAATPPPSFTSSKPELTKRVTTQIAQNLALSDLEQFQTELTKLGASVDPDAAKRYAEEFIKERGLKSGTSKELRDAYTIGEDPGLEPMAELVKRPGGGPNYQITQQFFIQQDPATGRTVQTEGLYQPEPFPAQQLAEPTPEQPVILAWRSDETKQGTAPRSFDDPGVKEKVVAAWRVEQARELAKNAAEKLKKQWEEIVETEKLKQNSPLIDDKLIQLRTEFAITFSDPAKEDAVAYEVLDGVGPLKMSQDPNSRQMQMQLTEFQLAPTAEIMYPTLEMQKQLLEQQKGPLANAEILVDSPKANYYLSVLERDTKKSSGEFSFFVYRPSQFSQGMQQGVQQRYQRELRQEAYERAIALLKAEFGYDKENAELLDKSDEG